MRNDKRIKVGTQFKDIGKEHLICEVVDIVEKKSIETGKTYGFYYVCKAVNGLSTNQFEVLAPRIIMGMIN